MVNSVAHVKCAFSTCPPKAGLIIDIQTHLPAGIIGQATGKFEFQQDQMHAL